VLSAARATYLVAQAADATTNLAVKNSGAFVHTFTVREPGINVGFGPHDEKLIEISGAAPGVYEFRCDISGHESMKGTLLVQ
jgi:uncharacterized cupredoxin-like copper-binding protein